MNDTLKLAIIGLEPILGFIVGAVVAKWAMKPAGGKRKKGRHEHREAWEYCIVKGCGKLSEPQGLPAPGAPFCKSHTWDDVSKEMA